MGLKAYKQHTAISINDICDTPAKTQGEDARIVEICETCPYEDCIETYTCVCQRFKQMKAEILVGRNKKHNRIKEKKKNNEK